MQEYLRIYLRFVLFITFSFGGLHAIPSDYLAKHFKNSKEPLTVVELLGGLSGAKNYKVTVEEKDYVLRVLNPAESIEVRQREVMAAIYAGKRGIGPSILYVADNYNAMIMDFIKGQGLTASLLVDKEKLLAFLQTIQRLHESTGDFPRGWTIFEKIRIQLEELVQSEIPVPIEAVNEALVKLRYIEKIFEEEPLVPCHNDLNALNVIAEGMVFKFIDWTDSGMGYAYNDLGYFVLVNCIGEERHCEILELYLGRFPSEKELHLLKLMTKVNMLRIFASSFPAYEPAIVDIEQRIKRKAQLEEMLWDRDLFPLSYFFDLHMKRQLNGKEAVVALSLSALRSFLRDENHGLTKIEKPKSIVLMQNFDPFEWKHVHVNLDKINDLATQLIKINHLKIADWTEILPQGLEMKERVEYIMGLICIDFCHWDFKSKQEENGIRDFYTKDDLGINVRGSSAMTTLAKRAYQNKIKIFDAECMKKMTVNDLRPHFMGIDNKGNLMEIPWLAERVKVMNEVGNILIEKWNGSFYNLLYEAKARAFNNGKGFIELLVRDFPRFKDEYIYKGKKIGIYKLAQLSIMALQSSLSQCSDFCPFKDCDVLTVCADYQLPRSLQALGILEYGSELKTYIDHEKLIDFGSQLEIELRMATVFAGHQLKQVMNAILADEGKSLITSQELDYLLWNHGRQLDYDINKHHLTLTIMY